MRNALRREYGYIALLIVCAALAVTAAVRVSGAYGSEPTRVDDFRPPVSALIDINTAEVPMLVSLPGIGEKLAQRIIEGRPYSAIEDICAVQGISDSMFAKLKDHICVSQTE